jgi:predicted amidohydrolase YtcJ
MRTLYRSSLVRTLSYPTTGEWVLVEGRHVELVGAGEPPAADRVVELPGTTIVPGFVDAHVHLPGTGVHEQAPGLGLARSAAELLDAIRAAVRDRQGPTLVHGYDESTWEHREPPTADDLDRVSDRPLAVVRVDGHLSLANRPALRESRAVDHPGVELGADGEPTGRVRTQANDALQRWFAANLAEHDVEELQLAAAATAAAKAVTTVHEMSLIHERGMRDLEVLLRHRQRLPVDVVPYVGTDQVSLAIELGLPRIGGDLPVDGSIGARTAWVDEPYADGAGSGSTYFGEDALAQYFHDGHLAGLQVGVHAIGDAAIERAIVTWERVFRSLDSRGRRHFRARRHRIEHAEMVGVDLLERAAMLGLALSVQPSFDAAWGQPGGLYEQGLGAARAAGMNPFREILRRGVEMAAGSDSPITTLDPMAGIAAFENHHDPGQRLSREEAIRVWTTGGARLAHQEDKKGSLEPGKHADLAAFDEDPFLAADPRSARPVLTVSLGRDVFAS